MYLRAFFLHFEVYYFRIFLKNSLLLKTYSLKFVFILKANNDTWLIFRIKKKQNKKRNSLSFFLFFLSSNKKKCVIYTSVFKECYIHHFITKFFFCSRLNVCLITVIVNRTMNMIFLIDMLCFFFFFRNFYYLFVILSIDECMLFYFVAIRSY